ncbi:hypothetical protein [Sphingobacterium puteale]|uniref:hypothetical protein n=1 Tax=Sphingobacterium puteale TaxID=2420510 RepID=UPI003D994CDC
MKNLNSYAMAIIALVIAAGSTTLMSFNKIANKQTDVTLFFDGDATEASQVSDPSNWAEDNPGSTCPGSKKACSMEVNPADLQGASGSRTLNPTKIILGASNTGTISNPTYVPTKAGGSSSNNITPHNQD